MIIGGGCGSLLIKGIFVTIAEHITCKMQNNAVHIIAQMETKKMSDRLIFFLREIIWDWYWAQKDVKPLGEFRCMWVVVFGY